MSYIAYRDKSVVIEVDTKSGKRFFVGFGKKKQVKTAWCVAGAKHFGPWCIDEIIYAQDRLLSKGYTSRTKAVRIEVSP